MTSEPDVDATISPQRSRATRCPRLTVRRYGQVAPWRALVIAGARVQSSRDVERDHRAAAIGDEVQLATASASASEVVSRRESRSKQRIDGERLTARCSSLTPAVAGRRRRAASRSARASASALRALDDANADATAQRTDDPSARLVPARGDDHSLRELIGNRSASSAAARHRAPASMRATESRRRCRRIPPRHRRVHDVTRAYFCDVPPCGRSSAPRCRCAD